MRLTTQQCNEAKAELLSLLQSGPYRTSQLSGTPKFHGHRTLSLAQVRRLLHELREAGKVQFRVAGAGMRTCFRWSLSYNNHG